jgi:GDP/UDP-N,N'-diacetylbacillosamine 2-epimerase (hydrolysing)
VRKIVYISGTRADFGLMKKTLQFINNDNQLNLDICVTGMHLISAYGNTYKEILEADFNIIGKVKVALSGSNEGEMSIALGKQIEGFTKILMKNKPDLVLLLGDRGEMLAGAISAIHLRIPIVHIHGGELSGTVDEPVRHAISKLSHYHFVATENSRNRLIKMGEKSKNIFVTGAPGIDQIKNFSLIRRDLLLSKVGLSHDMPFILLLFHPTINTDQNIKNQIKTLIEAILTLDLQVLAIMPNSDNGGSIIASLLNKYEKSKKIKTFVNFKRIEFLSLVSEAEVLIGNSSSGIIESASLGTPTVNVGDRQKHRERNSNVIDTTITNSEIINGLNKARSLKGREFKNIYGNGGSSSKILQLLKSVSLGPEVLEKVNEY